MSGFVFFIGLSLTTRNTNLPRFIRFNVQQALLLDIILIIPTLFADFGAAPLPQQLSIVGSNCVFYAWLLVATLLLPKAAATGSHGCWSTVVFECPCVSVVSMSFLMNKQHKRYT